MGASNANSLVTKLVVTMVGAPLLRRFNKAAEDLRGTQDSVLRRILLSCKDTVFGKQHGFDKITTVDEYRRAVPIRNYEEHRPYVERMCRGESDVLFPGKPIMYNTTSGTTDKPKLIPVSAEYFETAFTGISRLWLYTVMKDNPSIYNGKSLSAVAPAKDGAVEDGTPYGSISGVTYRNIPGVLKKTYSTPYPVICIRDYVKKYYAMMRCALACDITFIICPSPSNILRLHQTVMESFENLARDIRDGTLRTDIMEEIPSADRPEVAFTPMPERARRLERLMREHGDALRPLHYWPNCACVNLWVEGNFALVIPRLQGFFGPRTVLRTFGYQASEARAGLVLGNDWAHSALAAHVYHFEFIEETSRDSASPATLLAHELEVGKRYYILFSNGSGLYRYDINDIVEVIGHYRQFPLFRFIQKGEGITSLTGEKLSEPQVIQAVQETCAATGTRVEFYRMLCREQDHRYELLVEFAAATPAESRRLFAEHVDRRLQEINCEYGAKRGSRRLEAPRLVELVENSGSKFKEILIARGCTTDGQYKETFLTRNPVHAEVLAGLVNRGV